MATASGTPEARQSPAAKRPDDLVARYGRYIDGQLRKTRRHVRAVDVAGAVLAMAIGALVYLLAVAMVDQWLVAGGLGFTGRMAALVLLLAATIAWAALVLVPHLIWRINPVYAAQTIERSRPSLKNGLVNFLLLRGRPEAIPPTVFEAIEQQAAAGLSQVTVEQTVDRSKLVKLGWVLLAVVALCAIYKVASPKDPFRSFRRVMAPWADIAPPTRVVIASVQPGDAKVFHDQFVSITAEVSGVAADEQVTLYYSTADGQMVDRAVAMMVPPGDYRYTVELPPHAGGLQQDITYQLAAGDAVSERYHIKVLTTPSIVVDRVAYEFPAYTEMSARTIERQGDLSAIEGTRVTVYGTANDDIRAAYVDFDCDGRRDIPMLIDGREAKVTFPLTLKKGTEEPEHASYQLRFINSDGEENPKPVRYKIEVTPDHPPQIRFTEPDVPEGSELPVKPGAVVKMGLAASDADFKVAGVKLLAQKNGLPLLDRSLLAGPQSSEYTGSFLFDTKSLKLAEGDLVQYWAEVADDRQPDPNHASTPKYQLRITSKGNDQKQPPPDARNNQGGRENDPDRRGDPRGQQKPDRNEDQNNKDGRQPDAQQQGGGDKTQKQQGDPKKRDQQQPAGKDQNQRQEPQDDAKPDAENSGEPGEQGRSGKSGRRGDQKSDEPNSDSPKNDPPDNKDSQSESNEPQRVDPDADPGKAFKKIIEHRQKEEGDQGENEQPRDKQDGQERQPNQGDKRNNPAQDEPSKDQRKESAGGEKKQDRADSDEKSRATSGDKNDNDGNERTGQENRDDAEKQGEKRGDGEKRSDSQKRDAQGRGGQDRDGSAGDKQDRADGGQKSSDEKRDARKQPNQSENGDDKSQQGEQRPEQKTQSAKENPAREREDQRPGVKKPGDENRGDERKTGDKNAGRDQAQDKSEEPPADQKQGKPQPGEKGQGEKAQGEKGQADKGQGEEAQGNEAREQGQKQPGKQPTGQKGEGTQTGEPQRDQQPSGEKQSGDKKAGEKQAGDKPGDDKEAVAQDQNRNSKSGAASSKERSGKPGEDAQESTGDAPRDQEKEKRQTPMPSDKGQKGTGDQQKATDKQRADQEAQPNEPGRGKPQDRQGEGGKGRGAEDRQKPKQPDDAPMPQKGGNDQSPNEGDPGAGKSGGNKNGSPAPQEDNAPREKKESTPGEKGKPDDDQPESPSNSKHQSDSKGESGDRSGGGGKGGGQRSNSPGTGSAGQNTAADEGSGKAEQEGKGESTNRAGNQERGQGEQGGARDEQGPGSRDAPGDRKQGAAKSPTDKQQPQKSGSGGDKQDGGQSPGEKQDDNIDPSAKPSGRGHGDPAGNRPGAPTGGGGLPSEHDDFPDAPKAPERDQGADDPNLDYTRKATDLAIEYLKDQLAKDKPDQKLLDDLKWSREDMEHFVRQWERFKQQAKATDPDARQKLDEKLESLGLRPRGAALKGGQTQEGQSPTVRGGRRSEPPPDYAEQYREFTKGRAKAKGSKSD